MLTPLPDAYSSPGLSTSETTVGSVGLGMDFHAEEKKRKETQMAGGCMKLESCFRELNSLTRK